MSGTLQDVLSMLLAVVLANVLRVPGIALALALILLLQRESPGVTFRNAMQIVGGSVAACAVALFWTQMTDGTEVFRFLGFLLLVFVSGFCMAGSRYPLFFTIFGFYGFVDLAGWDAHHSSNAIVTGMLYNVASLALALGCAAAVNFLFATRHPGEELREEMRKRLRVLARFHRELAEGAPTAEISVLQHRMVQLAQAGDLRLNVLYEEFRSSDPKELPAGLHFRIGLMARVLEKSSVLSFANRAERSAHVEIAELCEYLLDPQGEKPAALEGKTRRDLAEIYTELSRYREVVDETPAVEVAVVKAMPSFFLSDAFSCPDAALYSLKLTLSAAICYVIYSAVAWPGILTCVVTVLFTGLSSTGAMKQKQLYRLSGAAIGGVVAILVESLLFPNMDSITAFVLVVGAVSLVSAWISRSPRIGYVGIQIAFAFFLTDLVGFSAASGISPARDRVIGVALGILVMWFVFDQVWPTRTSQALQAIRNRVQRNAGSMAAESVSAGAMAAMRNEVSADLVQMQALVSATWFDFGTDQHRELARSRRLTRETEAAAAEFYRQLHERRSA